MSSSKQEQEPVQEQERNDGDTRGATEQFDRELEERGDEAREGVVGGVSVAAFEDETMGEDLTEGPENDERRDDHELREYERADEDDDMPSATSSGNSLLDELMEESKDEEREYGDIDIGIDEDLLHPGFGTPLLRTPANISYPASSRTSDWLTSDFNIPSSPPPLGPTYRRQYIEPESNLINNPVSASSPSIRIVVGPDPPDPLFNYTQRIFTLPSTLLSSTSTFFANHLSSDPSTTTIHLPSTTPGTFQNFIDYTRSNIFSLNKNAPGFSLLPAQVDAYHLGTFLGCPAYSTAALSALHTLFTRQQHTSVQSPITASDILYVVRHTPANSSLRALFFDAVAAHWTRFEAFNIGSDLITDGERAGASWGTVYNQCADFRATLAFGLTVADDKRGRLLGAVGEYVSGRLTPGVRVREVVQELAGGRG